MAELGDDHSVSTLSRWMAHHIAELIDKAENAGPETRAVEIERCSEAILRLWRQHASFPSGKRPFEDFEPMLSALESLDPNEKMPRYLRGVRPPAEEEVGDQSRQWLDLADGLDYSARILIRMCLARAAEHAVDRAREWAVLAEEAGLGDDCYTRVVRLVIRESDLQADNEPDNGQRKELESRLRRLEGFIGAADALAQDIRVRLSLGQLDERDDGI